MALGENEVFEGNWNHSFSSDPAVGNRAEVVLGRKGLKDGDGEDELVLLLELLLVQEEIFSVVDVLVFRIFHPDPPWFDLPVVPVVPVKIGSD